MRWDSFAGRVRLRICQCILVALQQAVGSSEWRLHSDGPCWSGWSRSDCGSFQRRAGRRWRRAAAAAASAAAWAVAPRPCSASVACAPRRRPMTPWCRGSAASCSSSRSARGCPWLPGWGPPPSSTHRRTSQASLRQRERRQPLGFHGMVALVLLLQLATVSACRDGRRPQRRERRRGGRRGRRGRRRG